jgi:hypothetical protein
MSVTHFISTTPANRARFMDLLAPEWVPTSDFGSFTVWERQNPL